ncbi:MAG: ABC transporter substrate binding protein, partial [Nitrospirota bacterium]
MQNIVYGFKAGLESCGFIEGRNIIYIQHDNVSDVESVVRDMIAKKADIVFTMTAALTRKTKKLLENTGIPLIFGAVYDPVESSIVKSLLEPGGNVTGVKIGGSTEKAFEWLLKAVPNIKTVFVPLSSDSDTAVMCTRVLKKSADKAHVKLVT